MKKAKMMVTLVLAVSLGLGLFCFSQFFADTIPEVAPEVEEFVAEEFARQRYSSEYKVDPVSAIEKCKIAYVESIHGSVAAAQYANLMNYYYDTLDLSAFILAKDTFLSSEKEDHELGADGEDVVSLACKSVTEEGMKRAAENYPYILEYTPVSPRPDQSANKSDNAPATTPASATPVSTTMPSPAPTAKPAPVQGNDRPFPDVSPDAWYYDAVSAMKNSGIIMGCDDGLFHPERTIKQGEFYAMLLRAGSRPGANISGGLTYDYSYPEANNETVQANNHWATGVMMVAYRLQFSPYTSGEYAIPYVGFRPPKYYYSEGSVDRAEAVTRMVSLKDRAIDIDIPSMASAGSITFASLPDHDAIEQYISSGAWRNERGYFCSNDGVRETIAYAYNVGICKGVDEVGTFDPDKLLTRAEIAQLFYNAGFTYRRGCLPTSQAIGAYDFNSTENVVY